MATGRGMSGNTRIIVYYSICNWKIIHELAYLQLVSQAQPLIPTERVWPTAYYKLMTAPCTSHLNQIRARVKQHVIFGRLAHGDTRSAFFYCRPCLNKLWMIKLKHTLLVVSKLSLLLKKSQKIVYKLPLVN